MLTTEISQLSAVHTSVKEIKIITEVLCVI